MELTVEEGVWATDRRVIVDCITAAVSCRPCNSSIAREIRAIEIEHPQRGGFASAGRVAGEKIVSCLQSAAAGVAVAASHRVLIPWFQRLDDIPPVCRRGSNHGGRDR